MLDILIYMQKHLTIKTKTRSMRSDTDFRAFSKKKSAGKRDVDIVFSR